MRDPVLVRDAVAADAEILARFNLQMAEETEGRQLNPAVLAHGVCGPLNDRTRGFYLVAEMSGQVAGCLMVTTEWSDWRNGEFWWIQSVYVSPEFRRQGVFRALCEEVGKRAAAAQHVRALRLYVDRHNAVAQATYRRFGFAETDYLIFESPVRPRF